MRSSVKSAGTHTSLLLGQHNMPSIRHPAHPALSSPILPCPSSAIARFRPPRSPDPRLTPILSTPAHPPDSRTSCRTHARAAPIAPVRAPRLDLQERPSPKPTTTPSEPRLCTPTPAGSSARPPNAGWREASDGAARGAGGAPRPPGGARGLNRSGTPRFAVPASG